MAITLKEVAKLAGVSRSAVSRSFTDGASVSDKTRKKVEKAARELGYSPSLIARSLATNRTKLIGLVANNFQNPIFLEVFDLYTQALQEKGLRPLLVNLSNETDPEISVQMLRQYRVDGVIVATSTLPSAFSLAFKKADVPVVHAFGRFDPTHHVHVVGIDNQACGRMAAQTLIRHGYKSVGFLGGPKFATSTQDREQGFRQHLRENGIEIQSTHYADAYAYDAGRRAMHELLEEQKVEAIFCGDDLICIGAMDEAWSKGLRIPEDIGFIGFNDMAMASWQAYNLTTIRQPTRDIIKSSIELVVSMVENPDRALETRIFPCDVVERGTLRPMPKS
ncbi:LacI family DNA-binding transcriptional regulator [Maritalea sp.]|uniref:LacI family DNA-binding transcriptional regulator n=1 Tax=Maritalea sp. TaxID=2003361 RepID=UPI003EFAE0A5